MCIVGAVTRSRHTPQAHSVAVLICTGTRTTHARTAQQSEKCIAQSIREQQDNSSSSRPAYEFDLAAATPGSIEKLEWQRHGIDGAHHSPGGLGSLGVFLLNLKGGAGVIVMKQGSIQSASEFFCSLL
jgi:hypothetical protein